MYKLWSISLERVFSVLYEFILIFTRLDCLYIPGYAARKTPDFCHRAIFSGYSPSLECGPRALFYEDVPGYIAPNVYDHLADGWENVSDTRRIRPRNVLSKNCIRPEGKRSLRARIVESRSIREERKIGAPLPRDKRNLWPCLHGAPRLKLIRPSSLAFK